MPVRTHPGITRRILLAFVLLTLLPAAAITYLGTRAVGQVIEERLVRERAVNAARLVGQIQLPLSPLLMQRFKEMFGAEHEVAAELKPDAVGEELVSSMRRDAEHEFRAQLQGRATLPRTVTVGGHTFVVGAAEIRDLSGHTRTLYLLVDQHVLDGAKAAAVRPILYGAAPVLLIALAAGAYLAGTITRPVRKLSAQIEGLLPAGVADGGLQSDEGAEQTSDEATKRRSDGGAEGADSAGLDPSSLRRSVASSLPPRDSALSTQDSSLPLHDVELDAPRELADLANTFNRMLARLRQTQARLLETERLAAVGKIAASVAHEVRNPLAGIRMNLQLLQQHLAREGRPDESLNIAVAELDRLDAIVQEMLVLGRQSEPKLETVDLRALAGDVLDLLGRRLKHAGVTASIEGDPAVPARADPAQIKQVLLNLLLNATDAMPQGGRLTVRATTTEQGARIEIDDTGPGVDLPEGQDPFAWFSTTKSAGSGIGLAVCRQIVEAHGGKIGLEKCEGGTRAWILLKHQGPSIKSQTDSNAQKAK